MRRIIYTGVLVFGLLVGLFRGENACAQKVYDGQVLVSDVSAARDSVNFFLTMKVNIDYLELPSNRFVTLCPLLVNGNDSLELPGIRINGRRQHIMFKRHMPKDAEDFYYTTLQRRKRVEQVVDYTVKVPYQAWMKQSELRMQGDLCGCAGKQAEHFDDPLKVFNLQPDPWVLSLAYVTPKAEPKVLSETRRAFIDFPVNKTYINPDYRNNRKELAKIDEVINTIKADTNVTITGMKIHGFASPEGGYANNARLAQKRAEAQKEYVSRLHDFPEEMWTVESTPEDWAGFREELQKVEVISSDLKAKITAIIDDPSFTPDQKKQKIRSLEGGSRAWTYMVRNVCPALRHADYTVTYTVRVFNVEEAKEILKTKPQQLSLQEFFLVAQLYEPGSVEYNNVFETAVHMFPANEVANLNAANIALSENNLPRAARYLEKAGNSAESQYARAVLALMEHRPLDAEPLLKIAAQAGIAQAVEALEVLQEKRMKGELHEGLFKEQTFQVNNKSIN